jgi:hypothetical protein
MKTRIFLAILALGLFTSLAAAADAPSPSEHLKDLQYFAGSWQCKGTGFAFMGMPEHPTTATVESSWTLGKYWLNLHYKENKTTKNPMPVDVRVFWGWDEQVKKFASGSVDNMGSYAIQYSPGWDGDKLVFEGEMHGGGMTAKVRDLFTKVTASKLTHSSEMEMESKWTKMDEETCTKAK